MLFKGKMLWKLSRNKWQHEKTPLSSLASVYFEKNCVNNLLSQWKVYKNIIS